MRGIAVKGFLVGHSRNSNWIVTLIRKWFVYFLDSGEHWITKRNWNYM